MGLCRSSGVRSTEDVNTCCGGQNEGPILRRRAQQQARRPLRAHDVVLENRSGGLWLDPTAGSGSIVGSGVRLRCFTITAIRHPTRSLNPPARANFPISGHNQPKARSKKAGSGNERNSNQNAVSEVADRIVDTRFRSLGIGPPKHCELLTFRLSERAPRSPLPPLQVLSSAAPPPIYRRRSKNFSQLLQVVAKDFGALRRRPVSCCISRLQIQGVPHPRIPASTALSARSRDFTVMPTWSVVSILAIKTSDVFAWPERGREREVPDH